MFYNDACKIYLKINVLFLKAYRYQSVTIDILNHTGSINTLIHVIASP